MTAEDNKLNQEVDAKKIAFIACVNDDKMWERCKEHIFACNLPDDFSVEVLDVRNATSIFTGYQQGMESTNAKYKIYLHQDVMIVGEDFIVKLVDTFQKNEDCGLMGVVGCKDLPANGVWWGSRDTVGAVCDTVGGSPMHERFYGGSADLPVEVAALDGLLLATQYDVNWRTDLFSGWHFYDISACFEFKRKNYKVMVLPQDRPLVEHECGIVNLQGYDEAREIFLKEYSQDRYVHFLEKLPNIDERLDYKYFSDGNKLCAIFKGRSTYRKIHYDIFLENDFCYICLCFETDEFKNEQTAEFLRRLSKKTGFYYMELAPIRLQGQFLLGEAPQRFQEFKDSTIDMVYEFFN